MTREEFKTWAKMATKYHYQNGETNKSNRDHATAIRPHDGELANLYVRLAEAHEAIRRHLMGRIAQ